MTTDQAIRALTLSHTQAELAEMLNVTQGSISLWGEFPPALRQLQIERLTFGALRAEPDCDQYRVSE